MNAASADALVETDVDRDRRPAGTLCPCCSTPGGRVFHEVERVPTNSCILLGTREEALAYPRGDVRLASCAGCGFVWNAAFDPRLTEYSGRYEETQGFSPTFSAFHEALARALVERHGLRGKELIEIGCGKGEFLKLLCDLGDNRGLGFDPGYSEPRGEALGASRFEVIRDFFDERQAGRDADFVACKMTLEHIAQPLPFMRAAARTVRRPDGTIFIQVPESLRILRDCAFEDIYYEHCSYYTAGSLGRLFERLGFALTRADVEYGDQYLTVEASPPESSVGTTLRASDDLAEISALVSSFPARAREKLSRWSEAISTWQQAGRRVVIWGSGSKGVSFLTTVPGASELVRHAVDINPYRQGYFMSGTGQEIVGPEALRELAPDVVVVMNRVYLPEISRTLDGLGLSPELTAL